MLGGKPKRAGTTRWRIIALLAFANISIIALVWVTLDASYRQYQDRAAVTSRNTNRLVSQSIAGDIDHVDLALRSVADEFLRLHLSGKRIGPQEINPFLTRLQSRLPMVDALRVANARGEVVFSSGDMPAGVTAGDRDYFMQLRDNPKVELSISQPILGRISNKWVLIFARRIQRPNGEFDGIAYAPVTIEWFESKFNDLEVGPNGTVVMRGDASRDFDLLARFPHAGYVGQTKVSTTFKDRITASPKGGTYEARAGADNVLRTFSYQPIGPYPLITLVGMATEDYMGEWRREAIKVGAMAAAFLVVTTLAGFGMLRAWRTLERRTEELARSNADLEQFAYVASHDLQTPLRNISGYAQLLSRRYRGQLDAQADEFIDYIVGGVKRMSTMIPELLDYARVSTAPPELVPVRLDETLATVLATLAPLIQTTRTEITAEPLPTILGEPRQIESLFQNLIENALTYRHPDRTPVIRITARPEDKEFWSIAVHDNGIGIQPEYFDKIFVVFQRLDPSSFPDGTGIGLALCRRIVQRFGGDIRVESKPGKETTFIFTLRNYSASA
jgi:signal transduction histidine kinase